jgi:hypothetical protein
MKIKLKYFDLFPYPVQLYVNGNPSYKTNFGGLFSIFLIVGSCYLLFDKLLTY